MNPADQPTSGNTGMMGQTGTSGSGGDMLDKGVSYAEKQTGHQQSAGTTEKISDGLRSGFKKLTGKDVPVKDQEMR